MPLLPLLLTLASLFDCRLDAEHLALPHDVRETPS